MKGEIQYKVTTERTSKYGYYIYHYCYWVSASRGLEGEEIEYFKPYKEYI